MPLMDWLRAETHDQHIHVETLPFFKALAVRNLPLDSYVGFLNALAILYSALEQAVSRSDHPIVSAVWHDSMRKLPLLQRDLAYFKDQSLRDRPGATLRALIGVEHIQRRATTDPITLLGYLYVLEGSILGGIVLRSQIARAFKLTGTDGLAYLSSYERQIKTFWEQFTRRMNEAQVDAAEQQRIVEAGREAFTTIGQIVRALYPLAEQEMSELVSVLNPEAGNHPIPADTREIEAALRAGERSWQAIPYYEQRYGDRGRRFTWSDSSWIVTLVQHSEPVVQHQIAWLGRILAARGMPRWLLEQHLDVLHAELVQAIPERREQYAVLAQTAGWLRDLRRAAIDERTFQALAAEFETLVEPEWSERLTGIGHLLVAAVADEKAGLKYAVSSLESWLTDPTRFPQPWIDAVHTIVGKARSQTA